jgi:hypothetical protein
MHIILTYKFINRSVDDECEEYCCSVLDSITNSGNCKLLKDDIDRYIDTIPDEYISSNKDIAIYIDKLKSIINHHIEYINADQKYGGSLFLDYIARVDIINNNACLYDNDVADYDKDTIKSIVNRYINSYVNIHDIDIYNYSCNLLVVIIDVIAHGYPICIMDDKGNDAY